MLVQRIQNSYNVNRKQNISNTHNINFQAGKPLLTAVSTDSFHSESAKKLYTKIQRYFQLIGKEGCIKDKKLLHETTHYFTSKPPFVIEAETDVCLSINKRERNSNIKLYHKYSEPQKNDNLIFEATLDKNGQMIHGHFLAPGDSLSFERDKRNLRRMHSIYGEVYVPVGGNDREWSYLSKTLSSSEKSKYTQFDDSIQGAFEIFLELARLKTAIV